MLAIRKRDTGKANEEDVLITLDSINNYLSYGALHGVF